MASDLQNIDFSKAMLLGENLLEEGYQLSVTAGGSSMYPFIKKGDILLIKKAKEENIHTGDVLVFKIPAKFVAHRLINIIKHQGKNLYQCKGDASFKYDRPVEIHQIAGKVAKQIRNNKTIDFEQEEQITRNRRLAALSPYLVPLHWIFWILRRIYGKIRLV